MQMTSLSEDKPIGHFLFFGSILASIFLRSLKFESRKIVLPESCSVSAPGKALIAGGYLVLKRPNVGIVVSATARFYTTVSIVPDVSVNTQSTTDGQDSDSISIVIESPQFHSQYRFRYNYLREELTLTSSEGNAFIEKCILLVLLIAKRKIGSALFTGLMKAIPTGDALGMKLRADNDFYSQISELRRRNLPLLSSSLRSLPPFLPCPKSQDGRVEVNKTGMGSSAALTTSFVGALLEWFGVVSLDDHTVSHSNVEGRRIVHNVAQLTHAIAQEKCGSGFDVSAAVYGTQMYIRFDPDGVNACLEKSASPELLYSTAVCSSSSGFFLNGLFSSAEKWNQTVQPFQLPIGMEIIMGDVCGGSSSTSMAKEVLRWLGSDPQSSEPVWNLLAQKNALIYESFKLLISLAERNPKAYRRTLELASTYPLSDLRGVELTDKSEEAEVNAVIEELQILRDLFKRARRNLKLMGLLAEVGIEPEAQTVLADATEALPGVLCAGVPGAGGNDAIFAIYISLPSLQGVEGGVADTVRDKIESLWSTWSVDGEGRIFGTTVCPLILSSDSGEKSGLRVEPGLKWDGYCSFSSSY